MSWSTNLEIYFVENAHTDHEDNCLGMFVGFVSWHVPCHLLLITQCLEEHIFSSQQEHQFVLWRYDLNSCLNVCFGVWTYTAVLWVSEPILWVSELIPLYCGCLNVNFGCVNLYFGCLNLYRWILGVWTYTLGVWTYTAVFWGLNVYFGCLNL